MAQNAIEMLKEDHEKVRELLSQLTESTERAEKKRTELLEKIEQELSIHTRVEEEIFYPAYCDAGGREEEVMIHEAREEHRAVEALVLPDLKNTSVTSKEFSGRAKVLRELVEHHADEEEDEMFPDAEERLGKEELDRLGKEMLQRKRELSN